MKIKVTGQFENRKPFECIYPKYTCSQEEVENLYNTWEADIQTNSSTFDGYGIDFNSLTAEIIDDLLVPDVDMARFKAVLYTHGILDMVNQDMNQQNGIVKIFWDTSGTISFYHSLFQASMQRLSIPESVAKSYFLEAKKIE